MKPGMKRTLLLLTVASALSLAAAELILRTVSPPCQTGIFNPLTPNGRLYGWGPRPNTRTVIVHPDSETVHYYRTNSQGWRDVEHAYQKPAGRLRILVVGDSHTYGLTASLDHLYTRRLEALLRDRGWAGVEVISLAVPGWGTDQALEAIQTEGLRYRPDVVVYQFCDNDLLDNLQDEELGMVDGYSHLEPFLYRMQGDSLVRTHRDRHLGWKAHVRYYLQGSVLVHHTYSFLKQVREARRGEKLSHREWRLRQVQEIKSRLTRADYEVLFSDPPAERAVRSWALTEAMIRRMQEACRAGGAELAVLVESDSARRDWYLRWEAVRSDSAGDFMVLEGARRDLDFFTPVRRLREACARLGVPVAPTLRRYHRFELDPHLNPAGQEAMARDLADFLVSWPAFPQSAGK